METKVLRKRRRWFIAILLLAGVPALCQGAIVELDLFSIGCPTEFDFDSSFWRTNFDLGVTFTEISHVYIDWSGEITAGLATSTSNPQPYPINVGARVSIGIPFPWQYTEVWG